MSLKSLIQGQKPLTISIISFLLMLALVIVIGLFGGRHIIGYLEGQLVAHGIDHNQEVIAGMQPILERGLQDGAAVSVIVSNFQSFIEHAEPFGIRLFLVDRKAGRVLADSQNRAAFPYPLNQLLDSMPRQLNGAPIHDLANWDGNAWRRTASGSVELISLHDLVVPANREERWALGVSSDLSELLVLMDSLHLHLDVVLLITYGLIGLLGFLVLRWVGRRYEAGLEQQVAERTRELEQAQERLIDQARLATIGQTASVLAHEMRNPLASIKLALSGVSRSEGLADREKQRVDLVLGEVDRLEGMLSQTLDYVRPVVRDEQPVVLDDLLDKVLGLEEELLSEKKLRLVRSKCPQCPPLRMDREKMQQVLLNLLKNAQEASPDGGEIQVSLEADDKKLVLTITNQGPAPAQEVLDRACDFFFTTKARGTGLGLGLVKRVVEEHGGSVQLGSASGKVLVTIVLPTAD
ncbi:sensor histidine kinase [Thiolapillus sp.]